MAKGCARRNVIMDLFRRFYNMKMVVVDLDEGSARVLPLPEDVFTENIGGAMVNRILYEQYREEDPLVLGVGPLTGSFAPASCLMVATFRCLGSVDLCHTPILLRAGPEMKFSGVDFMVIKGVSSHLQALQINNTKIEFLPAEDMRHMSVPEAMEAFHRKNTGSDRFIILTGPAADHNSSSAVISTSMGGSLDKWGMASWMASRNLKAIILNGTGGLPFSDNNLDIGKRLKAAITHERQSMKRGCFSILEKMGSTTKALRFLAKSITKHMACYNCPFPCMSHVKIRTRGLHKKVDKKGFILLDHSGFLALAKKRGRESLVLMRTCLHLGLDPVAVAPLLPSKGNIEKAIEIIERLAVVGESQNRVKETDDGNQSGRLLRGAITRAHYRLFGNGIPPILPDVAGSETGSWERRVGMAMVLGVCPLMMLLFPRIETAELLRFVSVDAQDLEFLERRLTASVDKLLSI